MSEPIEMTVDQGSKILVQVDEHPRYRGGRLKPAVPTIYIEIDYYADGINASGVDLTPAEARALAHILTVHAAAADPTMADRLPVSGRRRPNPR